MSACFGPYVKLPVNEPGSDQTEADRQWAILVKKN